MICSGKLTTVMAYTSIHLNISKLHTNSMWEKAIILIWSEVFSEEGSGGRKLVTKMKKVSIFHGHNSNSTHFLIYKKMRICPNTLSSKESIQRNIGWQVRLASDKEKWTTIVNYSEESIIKSGETISSKIARLKARLMRIHIKKESRCMRKRKLAR